MKGFIGKSLLLGSNTDKGYFMSHGSGGGVDINQRRKSNPTSYISHNDDLAPEQYLFKRFALIIYY